MFCPSYRFGTEAATRRRAYLIIPCSLSPQYMLAFFMCHDDGARRPDVVKSSRCSYRGQAITPSVQRMEVVPTQMRSWGRGRALVKSCASFNLHISTVNMIYTPPHPVPPQIGCRRCLQFCSMIGYGGNYTSFATVRLSPSRK